MRNDVVVPFTKAVIAKLLATSGVTAITGTRIGPGSENQTMPFIVVDPLPETPHHGIGFNEPAYVTARAQIAGFVKTKHGSLELAGAISKALDGETLTVSGWGSGRMVGIGITPLQIDVNGVTAYKAARRITVNLPNQDTR